MAERRIVVVLGMHRSGTSAITRGLELLGVSLGDKLIPPGFDNAKGFWEDEDMVLLNDRVQEVRGVQWYGAEADAPLDWNNLQLLELRAEARALIAERIASHPLYGFKDPRTAFNLEFWMAVFEEIGVIPSFVICLRAPLEVAKSLERRNDLPVDKGLYLWAASVLQALLFTRRRRRVVVSFERVLEDPRRQLSRIADQLDLRLTDDAGALRGFAEEFIDASLRHEKASLTGQQATICGRPGMEKLSLLMEKLSIDEVFFDTPTYIEALAEIRTEIESQSALLGLYVESERQLHAAQLSNVAFREELSSSRDELRSSREELRLIKGELRSNEERLQSSQRELRSTEEKFRSSKEELRSSKEELRSRKEELISCKNEMGMRMKRYEELLTAVKKLEHAGEAQKRRLLESREEQRHTRRELLRLRAEVDRQSALVQSLQAHSAAMESSISWKVTAPLRIGRDALLVSPVQLTRKLVAAIVQCIWNLMPVGSDAKRALKEALFTTFHFPLKYTGFYREWLEYEAALAAAGQPSLSVADYAAFEIELQHRKYEVSEFDQPPLSRPARLVAFYLPQFHQIPENDAWWGEGFTEWSNVRPARQQYRGHYQPHVPGELGYYGLEQVDVMRRQAELAQRFGLGGFCFYFYWFSGERLLEQPILNYLEAGDIDFPFCLCWANENWSRTWDGRDDELLIAQDHSPEDDLSFISYVARYLKDERYIRVKGRPLLMVYRPSLLPDPRATAERWRNWCRENGIGEIFLVTTQSFEAVDPGIYGFDAAVEFPPNNTAPAVITEHAPDSSEDFQGIVYDWRSIAERSEAYSDPGYALFRGVNPAWDNTARRRNRGAIFAGSNPPEYQAWLTNAIRDTRRRFAGDSERLVFINAWNEWAEGAHLEPDEAYGYAYLNATRKALAASDCPDDRVPRRALIVAHDAHPHGAQNLALYMARYLAEDFGFSVDMVVLGDGPLLEQYRKYAEVHCLAGLDPAGGAARLLAHELFDQGHRYAICNTTVSGAYCRALKEAGLRVVALIHELPTVIEDYGLQCHTQQIGRYADQVVFPATAVADGFSRFCSLADTQLVVRPQGVYKRNRFKSPGQRLEARAELRRIFKLEDMTRIVLCAGYADRRKGVDLFVEMALSVLEQRTDTFFIWIGHWDTSIQAGIEKRVRESEFEDSFAFPGLQHDTDLYYAGADVYALMSREDPFPSVVMESLEVGVPVIAFEGAGGFTELLSRGCGMLVPFLDTGAFAGQVCHLLDDEHRRATLGAAGEQIVRGEFSFRHYLFDLLELAAAPIRKVSVVVPNYNYACYLAKRIESILHQTYPIYELIVLDDASTDESLEIIRSAMSGQSIDCQIVANERNSGSPFLQWAKGADMASGEFLWIAEADDLAEAEFLDTVMRGFDYDNTVLSYTESQQVDENGRFLSQDYRYYTGDISRTRWNSGFNSEGWQEICRSLSVKNTIPNVSGVVFSRAALLDAMQNNFDEVVGFRNAGDWVLYIHVLARGNISFSSRPLNIHRRHGNSVTISSNDRLHYEEIVAVQDYVKQHFEVDASTLELVDVYNHSLRQQFGLA